MDHNNFFKKFDIKLINTAINYKILVVPIINKIDLIKNFSEFIYRIKFVLKNIKFEINEITPVLVSFKKFFYKKKFLKNILDIWNLYHKYISTYKLNIWLKNLIHEYDIFILKGLKIKYVIQSQNKPPTFIFFINIRDKYFFNNNVKKFLKNSLKKFFNLYMINIKFYVN